MLSRNLLRFNISSIRSAVRLLSSYTGCTSGTLGKDMDFKCHIKEIINGTSESISPWHDVNYVSTPYSKSNPAVVNFIMEIPRGQSAKTEINTKLSYNPIMQDKKNGKLRFYGAPSMINYGAIPQTWENPHKTELTDIGSFCGDNDPLDIMDFSYLPHQLGDIYQVKGEMDWKILGVNVEDPICAKLRDYCDFFEHFHSDLDKMREWLRTYKMVDGKGENRLAYNGIPFQEGDAWDMVILPNHQEWERLLKGEVDPGKLCLDRKYK